MDERIHENEVMPEGQVPEAEAGARDVANLKSMVSNIVAQERENWSAELAQGLKDFETPDRSQVPEVKDDGDAGRFTEGRAIRVSSPYDVLYSRMSEREQQFRSADSDHWYREWIVGQFRKDRGQMLNAEAQLEGIYGRAYCRAALAEGAAGAAGAISAGAGGDLIPRPLENVVLIARDRVAKMRRFASSLTMTAQTHTIPTAAAMTAAMVGESTTATESAPTPGNVQVSARKGQVVALATQELLDDAAINLVNLYATRAGGKLGELEDDQFWQDGDGAGNNISAHFGGTAYAETTSGALGYVDVVAMYYAVGQAYRDNARWFAAADVLQFMANVRDGNGRPMYQGLQERPGALSDDAGAVGTILNKPVHEVPTTDGEIWFADAAALFTVATRQGIVTSASTHVKFDLDQVMWKFTQRFDGQNVDTVAGQHASGITSATSA